jgi:acyl carrier protein
MTPEGAIFDRLRMILHEVLAVDPDRLGLDMTVADIPGWDSFKFVELIIAIQDRLGVALRTPDLDHVRTCSDLVNAIVKRSTWPT